MSYFPIDQPSQCEGKLKYTTFALAESAVKHVRNRRNKVAIYKCKYCTQYHVGTFRNDKSKKVYADHRE